MDEEKSGYGYGKRPLWQWILVYVVIGGVVYALVYYFFFANGGYSYNATNTPYGTQTQTAPQDNTAPDTQTASRSVSVTISNFAFNPSQITVKAGEKVVWTNNDSVSHTVTSDNGAFDSGAITPGGTYSFVSNAPGTYSYHCKIHPSMKAAFVVTP